MIRWTEEQHIPLEVSLLTPDGWTLITHLKTVGPIANRSVVVPVETNLAAGENIQIRIRTGFMFWELDFAALDTQPDSKYTITRISPGSAVDEKGNSVLKELLGNDELYLSQPEPGNYATLTYNWNKLPAPGNQYTVILHTRGYYEPIRDYTGNPMTGELNKFREPGAMARFSLDLYRRIPKEHQLIALETR